MRDLGLGKYLVGRHGFDQWSAQSIPVCGDQNGIDYETLVRTRPTHIFLQVPEVPARLEELSETGHWVVRNYQSLTLEDIREMTQDVWDVVTADPLAEYDPGALDQVERAMDHAWSGRPAIDPNAVGPVLLLTSVSPPQALGPGSFHQQILEALGGTAAITDGGPYQTLSKEDLLNTAPSAIILFLPRAAGLERALDGSSPDPRVLVPGLFQLDLPAVRDGKVAVIDDPMCLVPCTSMISVADEMAEILLRWSAEQPTK
jgi:ABC-type Fe3+-hydroxamate transport system substrate-binding protein